MPVVTVIKRDAVIRGRGPTSRIKTCATSTSGRGAARTLVARRPLIHVVQFTMDKVKSATGNGVNKAKDTVGNLASKTGDGIGKVKDKAGEVFRIGSPSKKGNTESEEPTKNGGPLKSPKLPTVKLPTVKRPSGNYVAREQQKAQKEEEKTAASPAVLPMTFSRTTLILVLAAGALVGYMAGITNEPPPAEEHGEEGGEHGEHGGEHGEHEANAWLEVSIICVVMLFVVALLYAFEELVCTTAASSRAESGLSLCPLGVPRSRAQSAPVPCSVVAGT